MAKGKKYGGRQKGTGNALPLGAVAALKALRHRVPEGTPPEVAAVADEALGTIVNVMRGNVVRGATARLQAARAIRDEVAGPQVLKVQHTTAEAHAEVVFVVEARERERRERARLTMTTATPIEVQEPNGAAKNGS